MRSTRGAVALLTLSLAALPVTRLAGLAQEIPGADSETGAHLKAEHLAYVIANVDTLMADWRSAWSSKNAPGMAALYAEAALVIPSGGAPIVGREAIRRYYEEALRPAGEIGVSVRDVGVGEEIAYLFGDYRFVDISDNAAVQVFGRHVTIAMRYGRDWRIRAQLLLPAPESPRPALVGAAAANLEPLNPDRLGPRTGRTARLRVSFLKRAFTATNAVLAMWRESWRRDDLAEAVEAFSEEGLLILPGGAPMSGRAEIRSRLSDLLPAIGTLHSTILDFDASGGMSYAYGRYFCECRRDHGGDVLGHYLSVLTAEGWEWRMRALVLWTDIAEGDPAAR
jgi:uncharacterized protein (TIGR02246 family)